jgi:hypothetical protein
MTIILIRQKKFDTRIWEFDTNKDNDKAGVQPLVSPEPNGIAKFFANLLFVIANLPKD